MMVHINNVTYQSNRIVGGEIWFSIGEMNFPQEDWYDHVAANLEMWLPQFLSFFMGGTDSCSFVFLDGPAEVKLIRSVSGSLSAVGCWDHHVQVPETPISLFVLMDSVCSCLRKLHRDCYLQNIPFPFEEQPQQLTQLHKQEKNYV